MVVVESLQDLTRLHPKLRLRLVQAQQSARSRILLTCSTRIRRKEMHPNRRN